MGLPTPDPRPLCPLSSTEFVEPPTKKIPGYATGCECSVPVTVCDITLEVCVATSVP